MSKHNFCSVDKRVWPKITRLQITSAIHMKIEKDTNL